MKEFQGLVLGPEARWPLLAYVHLPKATPFQNMLSVSTLVTYVYYWNCLPLEHMSLIIRRRSCEKKKKNYTNTVTKHLVDIFVWNKNLVQFERRDLYTCTKYVEMPQLYNGDKSL